MPGTAKLSRKVYEKLGDDVATELVEWFWVAQAATTAGLVFGVIMLLGR